MRRITIPLTAAAAALALTGCGAFTPAPSATLTVTATPSTEAAAAPVETTPPAPSFTVEPTEAPAQAAPAPLYTPEPVPTTAPAALPMNPSAAVDGYLQAEMQQLRTNPRITKIGVEDDDVIIDLNAPMTSATARLEARDLVDEAAAILRQHSDDPNIAYLDLVAVRTSEGGTASMTQITPHPQCAGC